MNLKERLNSGSLLKLAKFVGVAYSTAHRWKEGKTTPSPAHRKLIELYFEKNS